MSEKEKVLLPEQEQEIKTEEVKAEEAKTEETKTRLQTLIEERNASRSKINRCVQLINEAEDLEEAKSYLKDIDDEIPKHNEKCGEIYLEKLISSGKSSLEMIKDAILEPTYKVVRVNQDRETGNYQVNESSQFMNLEIVNAKAKGGVGKDKNWVYYSHKLNYLMGVRTSTEILSTEEKRKEIAASWEMKDAVRSVLFPNKIDPLKDIDNKKDLISNKNITAALQYVITAMIGEEYKTSVTSFHARYVCNAYATHDKKKIGGGLKLSNDKQFTRLLMDVCNRILTGTEFEIEGGNIKNK